MTIVVGILSIIIYIYVYSIIQGIHYILTGFWLFFGLGVTSIFLVWIFSVLGIRVSDSSRSDCEVEYSQKGVSSVVCEN